MTADEYGRAPKARGHATAADCGHVVPRLGRLIEYPPGSGRFVCQPCKLAALGTATPPRRPRL